MLSIDDLYNYLHRHSVNDAGIHWITNAYTGPPSRRVRPGFSRNSTYLFGSRKAEKTIQAESRLEYRYAIEAEYSADVIVALDQPGNVQIKRHTRRGTKTKSYYTPDFLILSNSLGPRVVEVKSRDRLAELSHTYPQDWVLEGDGYQYQPAVGEFGKLGIQHITVDESTLNPVRSANLILLLSLRQEATELASAADEIKSEAIKILSRHSALSIQSLASELGITDLSPILLLIDAGFLYADTDNVLLSIPSAALVSTNPTFAHALQSHINNSNLLTTSTAIYSQNASIRLPSHKSLIAAADHLERINNGFTSRHLFRIKNKIKHGEISGIPALISAAPNYSGRGYRRDEIGAEHRDFINQQIDRYYLNPSRPSCHASYTAYKAELESLSLTFNPISEPTYRLILKKIHPDLVGYRRGGRRLRNSLAPPTPVYTRDVLQLIPFAAASIDHHKIDVEMVVARSTRKKFTARAWLTALVDHATKCILAFWISFDAPSRKSVGIVLRECIRKFGGLPRLISTDGGAEFRCDYLKQLYLFLGTTVVIRPPGDGRAGSEVEGKFSQLESEWATHRNGKISNILNERAISSSHSAAEHADLDIHQGWQEICMFVEHQNNRCIGDMEFPPIVLLKRGLEQYPSMMVKRRLDDEFIIQSSVDCRTLSLDRQRGIHIGNRWFSHPRLFDPTLTKSKISVRIDPENPYKIYAEINNQWIACLSRGHDEFLMLPRTQQESTAIRMSLGHAARESARKDDQVAFVKKLHHLDACRQAERQGFTTAHPTEFFNDEINATPTESSDLFSQARELSITPLSTTVRRGFKQ